MADANGPAMVDCPGCDGGKNPPYLNVCQTCNGLAKVPNP